MTIEYRVMNLHNDTTGKDYLVFDNERAARNYLRQVAKDNAEHYVKFDSVSLRIWKNDTNHWPDVYLMIEMHTEIG